MSADSWILLILYSCVALMVIIIAQQLHRLYAQDDQRSQALKKAVEQYDRAFLRALHIKAEEDTCKPSSR